MENTFTYSSFSKSYQQKLCYWVCLSILLVNVMFSMGHVFYHQLDVRFYLSLSCIPVLLFALWLNQQKLTTAAIIILSVLVPFIVFLSNFLHHFGSLHNYEARYEDYIMPRIIMLGALAIPMLLFDIRKHRKALIVCIIIHFILFFGLEVLYHQWEVDIWERNIDAKYYTQLLLVFGVIWIVVLGVFLSLKNLNYQVESQLIRLNDKLEKKQIEVESQNKSLREQSDKIKQINSILSEQEEKTRLDNLSLAEKVSQKTTALKEINSELDLFLYRSSHDLRRPLTTLMGLAEVARATLEDESAQSLFDKVDYTARQMDLMLTKLRMVSDINSDNLVFDTIAIRKIIRHIERRFKVLLQNKNIQFEASYDPKLKIWSNDTLLNAVLSNLMENAIQFTRQKDSFIKIDIKEEENKLNIIFSDNGQGIESEYQDRVFDMYFRANEEAKGNGLGLYVVRKALEKLRGSIRMESEYRQGSTFYIYLPILKEEKAIVLDQAKS